MERGREAAEEVAAPAQYFNHPGRDRPIRREFARDEPMDAGARAEGKVDGALSARHVEGGPVNPPKSHETEAGEGRDRFEKRMSREVATRTA